MSIRRMITVLAVALPATLLGGVGAAASGDEQAQQRAAGQLLYYNHAYAVVDKQTADAVENSAYLRQFANFEVRTTTGGGMTWKGRYLYGRETYMELFAVGDLPGQDAEFGSSGLAYSTERAGDLAKVVQGLAAQGITDPAEYRQTRDFGDGVRVPWFDTIRTTADQYVAFDGWSMEYLPEYFADPRSKTEPASYEGDVSRERYLSDAYQDRLMRDLTYVHLAVPEQDLNTTLPLLRAGGLDVQRVGTGAIVRGGGTTVQFDAVPRARAGLKKVVFSLNKSLPVMTEERIGNSTLAVGPGARAVWTFDAP